MLDHGHVLDEPGFSVPGVVTGKPVAIGGSRGRAGATRAASCT